MTNTGNKVRTIHWTLKVLLTVLFGGPLFIGAFFLLRDSGIPLSVHMTILLGIFPFSATVLATFLYLREGNGWRRSLLMGFVIGVVSATIIMLVAYQIFLWEWESYPGIHI